MPRPPGKSQIEVSAGLRGRKVDNNYLYDEYYGFSPVVFGTVDPFPGGGQLCTPTAPATGCNKAHADVFLSNYTNLQVSSTYETPGGASLSLVNNAASSRSEGAEFEVTWAVSRNFRLSTNITFLEASYVSYLDGGLTTLGTFCHSPPNNAGNPYCIAAYGGGCNPGSVQNLSGRPTTFAPRWSGDLSAVYNVDLPASYSLALEATPYFTSGYFLTGAGTDDPFEYQGDYARLDARVGLSSPDSHWTVDLIGKNLTDRTILTYGGPVATTIGIFVYGKQMYRNLALQGRYRF